MKVAIIGIRGLPNTYGGFETLAEYLVKHLSKTFEITVYCSSIDLSTKLKEYNGAKLKYIPISSHGAWGIIYDSISLLLSVRKFDKIIFLGFGGGFVMHLIKKYRHKMILNIGGLDWKRDKWSSKVKRIIKISEALLVKYSSQIISDNVGIQDYIFTEYGRSSTLIAYGGDQTMRVSITPEAKKYYPFLESKYAFIVTRIQVDNNVEMILKAFMKQNRLPIVIVGNWNDSKYGKMLKSKYLDKNKLILLDAIYDQQKLDILRSNCTVYIHGHSAGGTNPSLVEAMFLGLPIFAFASGYNEYTTYNKAIYFKSEKELTQLINNYESLNIDAIGKKLKELADKHYRWAHIANEYKKLILKD
ncbi:MAG: DUF1972 domain-containing protein [Bacteroidota bacterium]|nr:DUF1972 domain-containing protein [Bacteroidota bacterium]